MNTTDHASVEYRLNLARAMREAGASFDVIAEVLRAQMQHMRQMGISETAHHHRQPLRTAATLRHQQ